MRAVLHDSGRGRRLAPACLVCVALVAVFAALPAMGAPEPRGTEHLSLRLRSRSIPAKGAGATNIVHDAVAWNPRQTAIIICDMWDKHWCKGATRRVAEMAPAMNAAVAIARRKGVLIIHAPSSCMAPYGDHPARKRAGKNVVLVRDLTDTMYNSRRHPFVNHFAGTDLVIEYIETYVCPTVSSSDITGAPPFRFRNAGSATTAAGRPNASGGDDDLIAVDIGIAGQPVQPVQPGWTAWTQAYGIRLTAGFDPAFTVELNPGQDWRDRGDKPGSPQLERVVRDGYKTLKNDIRLTFRDLDAGDYRLVLYSCDLLHDGESNKGEFDVLLNGKRILKSQGSVSRRYANRAGLPVIGFASDGQDITIELKRLSGEIWINGFVLVSGASGPISTPGVDALSSGPSLDAPVNRDEAAALRRAVNDLAGTFGNRYPKTGTYLRELETLETAAGPGAIPHVTREKFEQLRREALLANPLLDFDRLLVVKRRPFKNGKPGDPDRAKGWDIGFPRSSFGKSSLKPNTLESEIAVVPLADPAGPITALYRPETPRFVAAGEGFLRLAHQEDRDAV